MFFLVLHTCLKYVYRLSLSCWTEEEDGACDMLQLHCRSAGAGTHGPLLMRVYAVILLEGRNLGFDAKPQPSILLQGVVSIVMGTGCVLLLVLLRLSVPAHMRRCSHAFHVNLDTPVMIFPCYCDSPVFWLFLEGRKPYLTSCRLSDCS